MRVHDRPAQPLMHHCAGCQSTIERFFVFVSVPCVLAKCEHTDKSKCFPSTVYSHSDPKCLKIARREK